MKFWTIAACLSLALNAGLIVNISNQDKVPSNDPGESARETTHGILHVTLKREEGLTGKELDLPLLDSLSPLDTNQPALLDTPARLLVVLVFSRVGCNTCLEEQLDYLRDMTAGAQSDRNPDIAMAAIVLDGDPQYVTRFRRVQRLPIPFYLTDPGTFDPWMNQDKGPLLLLVNPRTAQILTGHVPNPGLLERSQLFGVLLQAIADSPNSMPEKSFVSNNSVGE